MEDPTHKVNIENAVENDPEIPPTISNESTFVRKRKV